MNIKTRIILDEKNIKYEKVTVKVDLDRSDENKTKFIYNVDIIGDVSPEIKKEINEELKKSPVRKTLSKEIEFIGLNESNI